MVDAAPSRPSPVDDDLVPQTRRITLPRLATIAVVAAVLHLGQEVFLPLAIAMLLTFALSPAVTWFRKRGVPLTASVLVVAFLAFSIIAAFSLLVASQLSTLARDLPTFQDNILVKLDGLKQQGGDSGLVARLTDMAAAINHQIGDALPADDATGANGDSAPRPDGPMQVEVIERQSPLDMLVNLVMPIVSPLATTGLVVVVVIFMLLEREDLRDRFIRLTGSNDLHRTTQVLEDAGSRVTNYLLIQLLVNVIYAIPIGLGLWLIGVPNALLWGLLTLVLRFVPYIGSVLSAAFPLFLAFAVSPEWNTLLWTAALFIVVELATSNIIEPWLYGSRTGVSPLAIIVSAIFWTWIWGPLGLVLSTPLTVCLVVLGRHIPQFALFDILFGDEPVLAPHARLYQRWLAGDTVESTFRAAEALEEDWLSDYYRDTALPALILAQADWSRGVLNAQQEDRLATTAMAMVEDLQTVAMEEAAELGPASNTPENAPTTPRRVLSFGGRSALDDVAAAMLAQALIAEGAEARALGHQDLAPARLAALDAGSVDAVVLNFLDPAPSRLTLLHLRRLKRAMPHLRVGVVLWDMPDALADSAETLMVDRVAPDKIAEAEAIGADFVVTAMEPAIAEMLSLTEPRPLPEAPRAKPARSRARNRAAAAAI
ncbi:AI-2E family transporter [Gemmobacter serpentinus]|uniref:AI-2E family transporter n=1 Tax=Gemmobacter serpentinus TaxID=2652247 RepID=UPI00124EC4F4|nr:AI-2E family transporter [Gemmobacter serpentinus]